MEYFGQKLRAAGAFNWVSQPLQDYHVTPQRNITLGGQKQMEVDNRDDNGEGHLASHPHLI